MDSSALPGAIEGAVVALECDLWTEQEHLIGVWDTLRMRETVNLMRDSIPAVFEMPEAGLRPAGTHGVDHTLAV
jgi:hypothetical protein